MYNKNNNSKKFNYAYMYLHTNLFYMTITLLIIILESKVWICGFQSYMMLNENTNLSNMKEYFSKDPNPRCYPS